MHTIGLASPVTATPVPLISVVMPAYNSAATIGASIESILNQTVTDLELIIVYDRSSDTTETIIEEYRLKDPRVKPLLNEEKHIFRRLPVALNAGLSQARGSFIARMDSDDIAFLDRFEKQLRFMEQHPDLSICGMGMVCVDPQGHELRRYIPAQGVELVEMLLIYGPPIGHPTWFMKRSTLDIVPGYREVFGEDYDFISRLIEAGGKVDNCPEYGLYYLQAPSHRAYLENHKGMQYTFSLRHRRRRGLPENFSFAEAERITKGSWCRPLEERGHSMMVRAFEIIERHPWTGTTLLGISMLLVPASLNLALRKMLFLARHFRYTRLAKWPAGSKEQDMHP